MWYFFPGTEPLGPGAVIVGQGTVDEASTAAQKVCTQLVLLNGTLDMSSKLSGPRTAEAKHVAMNRTLGAGLSVAKVGAGNARREYADQFLFMNMRQGGMLAAAQNCG